MSYSQSETKPSHSPASVSATHDAQLARKGLAILCLCRGFTSPLLRNVGYFTLVNSKPSYSRLKDYGRHSTAGSPLGCKVYLHCKASIGGNASLRLRRARENIYKKIYVQKFSYFSASGLAIYQAQFAWRRLSKMLPYKGVISPPVNKITCAMSLAFSRFHRVPTALAFIGGELACSSVAWADGEYFPTSKDLFLRAQDCHIYLITLFFSTLEFFIVLFRAVYLAVLFSPIIIMAPFADTSGVQYRNTWIHLVHRTLEKAGPAFIKWGQWAATRPDLFPSDICKELAKLHSKAPTHSFAHTKRTVENAFGRSISDIFEHFEEEPVASGSIAQVHRASLRFQYSGQHMNQVDVAVKVRHPGVDESIRRDIVIMHRVAKVSKFVPTLKCLRLDETVQQFGVFMMSQVDLAREAAHLSRFIYNFRRWKDVSFPKPFYPLVHPSVLVETYEKGESVAYYVDELEGNDRLKSTLSHIGTHVLLKMLLVDNFIHADLHPGNILVRIPNTGNLKKQLFKTRPHLVFLDVGMVAELSGSDRINLSEFFKAVALRDGRTAAQCTLNLSKQQKCPNPKAFIEEVENTFSFWATPEGDIFHPAECMHQLLEQVRRHKVNIDGNVCTVMVTTLVLEGWQRKLDPDYDVLDTLRAWFSKSDWTETISYTITGLMAP